MVRDDGERTLLFDLDTAIQGVNRDAAQALSNSPASTTT
jgi:predicted 2-oxoglutarate/Fe(II)-dependent dioxygenase YbiX